MGSEFWLAFLAYPLTFLDKRLLLPLKVSFIGERPSFALMFKFFREVGLQLKKNAELRVLNFDSLHYIQQTTKRYKEQLLLENKEFEQVMLKKSSLSLFPHEVTRIRIVNSQGEDFGSEYLHGSSRRGASHDWLKKEIAKLCFQARKKGLIIEEVEIAHTHPSLEVLIVENNQSKFFFNGLSSSDKKLGEMIAQFLPYPLRVKAITPSANYSMIF